MKKTSTKRKHDDVAFRIRFDEVRALKQLIDITQCILTRVSFRIVKEHDSVHLSVDTIDPKHVCIVQGRVECTGDVSEADTSFCVDTKDMKLCLKNVYSHEYVLLEGYKSISDITLFMIDAQKKTERIRFKLNTYDQEVDTYQLENMTYDLMTEVTVQEMRRNLKMSRDFSAEDVVFSVYRDKEEVAGCKTSMILISSKGTAEYCCRLVTSSKQDADSIVSGDVGSVDDDSMECVYKARFGICYLSDFVHAMENETLTMKLDKDKPLLIEYDLGISSQTKSMLRLVLAPYVDTSSN